MEANNVSCSSRDGNMTPGCGQRCSMSPFMSINYNQPELSVVAIALLFVVIATMLCNLLVGFALMRFRSLRNVSNMLIGNLALSDFLLSVGVLPLSAVNECLGYWVFGRTACNVWLLVDVLFCTSSIWNLCIIAFDRFTATFYPLWYRGVGRTNSLHAFLYAAVVWTIAAAACLPPLFNWNDLSANYVVERVEPRQLDAVDSCSDHTVYRCVLFRSPSYVLYSASVSFYIPCFVTFFLYINILVELRRRRCKSEALKRDRHQIQVRSRTPAPSAVVPPISEHWNCDGMPASGDSTRAPITSAVVTWMLERNSDDPTCSLSADVDDDNHDHHQSNDSSLASPTHPLSIHSHDDEPITALNDDDVIQAPAQNDVTNDLNELTPMGDLSPASNSTGPRRSVAETFIRGFSHFSHRRRRASYAEQLETTATIRTAIIVAVLCGTWLGFFTIYVVDGWCTSCRVPRRLYAFFFWLGYVNSAVNPILYAVFKTDFREAFQRLMCRHRRRQLAMDEEMEGRQRQRRASSIPTLQPWRRPSTTWQPPY